MNIPDLDLYRMTSANKADFGLNDKYVILFEGTIWKRRGLQVLIEAVNILRNQLNIHLLVVERWTISR
jgi:glycosyltransferase involved in cell wall biosynthesis